ncbi:MAG: hypothetical protein AAF526_13475 [Pseudomonadota bacterium]
MDDLQRPGTQFIETKDLENIFIRARQCAEDLIAEVEGANPGDHPVTVRRRERDTVDARWLLEALPALASKYDIAGWKDTI